jgi:hypothetical protein
MTQLGTARAREMLVHSRIHMWRMFAVSFGHDSRVRCVGYVGIYVVEPSCTKSCEFFHAIDRLIFLESDYIRCISIHIKKGRLCRVESSPNAFTRG